MGSAECAYQLFFFSLLYLYETEAHFGSHGPWQV